MVDTNKHGFTWREWREQAGFRDVAKLQSLPGRWRRAMLDAWLNGEDPTEFMLSSRVAA